MNELPATDEAAPLFTGSQLMDDSAFNKAALTLFDRQRQSNPFLSRYYAACGCTAPAHWTEIPGVPTSAFKRTAIRGFPEAETVTWFQTSGTTEGESGRHYFSRESLKSYEMAIVPNFQTHLIPENSPIPMAILTPPPAELQHSSLVHMMDVVKRRWGTQDSQYFMAGWRPDGAALSTFLKHHSNARQPVFLLGTAFAFSFVMNELGASGNEAGTITTDFRLPPGSRIMETGGFKGRTREIPRPEFYRQLSHFFGISESMIINEYGMTELSSQFYDVSLITGQATDQKSIPPWTRILCIDPLNNQPVANGNSGLIRIYDLANTGSAFVLQTEDVGILQNGTFRVLGRIGRAQIRGCSLDAEAGLPTTSNLQCVKNVTS